MTRKMRYEWEFGERLREARVRSGMNQDQLGKAAYATRNSISSWENGHTIPSALSAKLLAEALHVSIGWLVGGEGEA